MTAIAKTDRRFSPSRWIVWVLGAAYIALAYSGFFAVSDQTRRGGGLSGGNEGDIAWGVFGVSTVSSLVHALCGAFLVLAGFTLVKSTLFGWAAAGVLAVLGVYAVFACVVDYGDPLNLVWANVWLYWASAAIVAVTVMLSAAGVTRRGA